MKAVYTEAAARDLAEIIEYLTSEYPALVMPLQNRIQAVLTHVTSWPELARAVTQRSNVRVAPLVRYPYKIFYRVAEDTIEVVHIRHTSRRPWDDEI